MKTQPLDDMEMFELLQACYPEKFPDDEDETFEDALNFASELSGFDELADLLGRVAMLTMPMKSGLTERLSHCLGPVKFSDGAAHMMAVVRRDVTPNAKSEPTARIFAQVGSTDGLGVAVPPAPTFEGNSDGNT